jgi:Na+/phosphate symporter
VSSLNGFNAFLLALISYLKLDAKSEAHRTSAYKFDKLQSQLEFSSGKSMFSEMTYDDMIKIINDAEANVREIKETNKFILPEAIRNQYPKLCNTNVFAEVKRVQNTEMQMTNTLMNILNEQQWFRRKAKERELTDDEMERKRELKKKELDVIHEIISLKDDYLLIDDQFEKEMLVQRKKQSSGCRPFGWLKT